MEGVGEKASKNFNNHAFSMFGKRAFCIERPIQKGELSLFRRAGGLDPPQVLSSSCAPGPSDSQLESWCLCC